jgi:hypothetical protein
MVMCNGPEIVQGIHPGGFWPLEYTIKAGTMKMHMRWSDSVVMKPSMVGMLLEDMIGKPRTPEEELLFSAATRYGIEMIEEESRVFRDSEGLRAEGMYELLHGFIAGYRRGTQGNAS